MSIVAMTLLLAAGAAETAAAPAPTAAASDPSGWSAELRATIEKTLDKASVKARRPVGHEQEAQRARGVPVVLKQGAPQYPRYSLDEDVYGCVIVAFDILPSGKTDQFEVVSADPPGVFDMLAMRMMLLTEFEKPAKGAAAARYRKAVFVLLPKPPPAKYTSMNQRNEEQRDQQRSELRAACEARAP